MLKLNTIRMEKIFTADELRSSLEKFLSEKGCSSIFFPDRKDDLVVAIFDCKNIFEDKDVENFSGWTRSGVVVNKDSSLNHQYQLHYRKGSL